jgi:hypothetical protein
MLQRNELWVGLLIGVLLPLSLFGILYGAFWLLESKGAASGAGLSVNFRMRTLFIVAMAANLWPMRIYRQRRWEDSMRGIVLATGMLALAWLFYYGPGLF